MSKSFKKDLTGQRFGRLTVLEFVPTKDKYSHWKCKCDCGNITFVSGVNLTSGGTTSCGCKKGHYTHGLSNTRLYKIWADMKKRCYNPNQIHFKDYGGRGIIVCVAWKDDFQAFYNWAMSNGYDDNLTIDRINNDGNYEPSNCRWADAKTQRRNMRTNTVVNHNGKKMCLAEVAELCGTTQHVIAQRYFRGDRGERLFRPIRKKKK